LLLLLFRFLEVVAHQEESAHEREDR
jgi:hypothetical protein